MGDFMKNCDIYSTWDVGAAGGNREDLIDVMVNLSPYEAKFWTSLGKTVARGLLHEHMIDELESPGDPDNGDADVHCTPESSDARFDPLAPPCRVNNLTHIFRVTTDISDTQQAIATNGGTAGISNMIVYQSQKKMKLLNMLIEFALLHSRRALQAAAQYPGDCAGGGSPQNCRKMDGIFAVLGWDENSFQSGCLPDNRQGTTIDPEGSPYSALAPDMIADLHEIMYLKGANPKDIWVNTYQKRQISNFYYQHQNRNTPVESKKLSSIIDVIETDFGMLQVNLHRYMPTRRVLLTDNEYLKIAVLRAVKAETLARIGNSNKMMIEGELTLEALAPATLGQVINLINSDYGRIWAGGRGPNGPRPPQLRSPP